MMQMMLEAHTDLRASHSLAGFETPHFHLWKITVAFVVPFPLQGDRVIDLVNVKTELDGILDPLKGAYLNTALQLSPTSENLCAWVWERISAQVSEPKLYSVRVSLCNLEGVPMGAATLSEVR